MKLEIVRFIVLFLMPLTPLRGLAQHGDVIYNFNRLLKSSRSSMYFDQALQLSKSGNAYDLMGLRGYLGANNVIVAAHRNSELIERQWRLIDNIIKTAETSRFIVDNKSSFKDDFKGWISTTREKAQYNEVALYESYSFFYIAQFLYYTKVNGWRDYSMNNYKRWSSLLTFIETNIWTKWYDRSLKVKGNNYWFFLRGRTHMGAHWAGVAMYLNDLSQNTKVKKQTKIVVEQYDTLLKRNLRLKGKGYVWNSTYDNIKGTFASAGGEDIIQDVSHGNHVVSYVVAAHQLGNKNWKEADLRRMAFTLKTYVYDKSRNVFRDNVDGTKDRERPGWGNFVGDGWVKLADYDDEVKWILKRFERTQNLRKYNQELQFKVTLNKNQWGK